MRYRPIDLDTHPFLCGPERTGEHEAWRPSTTNIIFQPAYADQGVWPLYWVIIHFISKDFMIAQPGTGIGFTVDVSVKHSMDGFWTACNRWEPIPFEFLSVISQMLENVFEEQYGERP